ncbi:hypothetical protein BAUCODRAFT_144632 [Baudoinia panamericana UAMH 10762]|uniref:Uncharacterized protein n=1 Tax=Baudoinia panamericana (strain UAMH 10762) TaxID=717646 RepID=M2MVR6_BAUPA|nr:uncharacterized protein BAUCODRAFT_144632 [Baudoinia panamericana UAMH 10762]EMD01057.1 hypothetical protein BAUCODRAFT_144632 [Baudoinia panamericana UAMH 10762]
MPDLYRPSWVMVALSLLFSLVPFTLATSVLQYWRLRKIPGPPAAAWTNLWLMWQMNRKESFYETRKRLHQRYGPVQRYGPNRVMFSDLSAVPVILGTTNILPKASNHEPLKAWVNGSEVLSFVALTDDAKAARLKRNLHATFSSHGVLGYEAHVDHTVSELVGHLQTAGSMVDLADWLSWFAFDTVARIGFSEDQGFMSRRQDVDGALEAGRRRFEHWNFWWTLPSLEGLIYKNWVARNRKKSRSSIMRLAMQVVERRKAKGGLGTHNDLLDLYMQSAESDPQLFSPSTILGLTITTMQAGAETTAYSTAICMFCLVRDKHVLAKLRAEIESVAPPTAEGWDLPPTAVLRKLPYLEACIKESGRLYPSINIMLERTVTDGHEDIAGVHVPKGTIVAINTAGLNTNPNIYGADFETYRPERWLEGSEEQRILMNRANLAFSAGKRMCLGINVAWLEMRKAISALVMNFEMELAYPERGLKQMPGIFGYAEEVKVNIWPRRQDTKV